MLQNPGLRQRFDDALIELISDSDFRMVCIVLDKLAHRDRYDSPLHPCHYCLTAMLQRYCGWLNYAQAVGDVLAEARGRSVDRQLEHAYSNIYHSGMFYMDAAKVQHALTSASLKLKTKADNIAGLQIADLLAHPMKQSVLWKSELGDEPGAFARRVSEAAKPKFNFRADTKQFDGYGWRVI